MSTIADLHPTIARAIEAFNEHDTDGFIAEFAEDGTFLDPVQESELTKAELREYVDDLSRSFRMFVPRKSTSSPQVMQPRWKRRSEPLTRENSMASHQQENESQSPSCLSSRFRTMRSHLGGIIGTTRP